MGPISIEGIIGDGAIYHADRECAPEAAQPCERHGQWACGIEGCPGHEFGVIFSYDNLDGSECCDTCTMPLDQAAFDCWMDLQEGERHASGDCGDDCSRCAESEREREDQLSGQVAASLEGWRDRE